MLCAQRAPSRAPWDEPTECSVERPTVALRMHMVDELDAASTSALQALFGANSVMDRLLSAVAIDDVFLVVLVSLGLWLCLLCALLLLCCLHVVIARQRRRQL